MSNGNFFRFERKNDDFPFYNESRSPFNLVNCIVLLASIAIGFFLFSYNFGGPLHPFLNVIFPLAGLIFVTRGQWTFLFRRLVGRDILLIIGTFIVNMIVTFVVGAIVVKIFGGNANPAAEGFNGNFVDAIPFFLSTIPMLFGEELITIIPFLIVLTFAVKVLKMNRKPAIILALLVAAVLFGVYHLPTYNWNIAQAILGIGIARIVLLYPYLKTKNIWTSFIVHVMNDWTLFGIAFVSSMHH